MINLRLKKIFCLHHQISVIWAHENWGIENRKKNSSNWAWGYKDIFVHQHFHVYFSTATTRFVADLWADSSLYLLITLYKRHSSCYTVFFLIQNFWHCQNLAVKMAAGKHVTLRMLNHNSWLNNPSLMWGFCLWQENQFKNQSQASLMKPILLTTPPIRHHIIYEWCSSSQEWSRTRLQYAN